MASMKYPQFLLVGDSIVQFSSLLRDGFCFGAGLEEHCQRRLDVINRGFSGYNTANALAILHDLIPSTSCAKVDYLAWSAPELDNGCDSAVFIHSRANGDKLILFGANDACLKDGPTGQHVPLQQYRTNLKTILSHSSIEARQPTIFLVTPPPINEAHLREFDSKKGYSAVTRHQKVTAQYAEAVREVAKEYGHKKVVLVDLWEALMKEARLGLSPTSDGQSEMDDDEGLRKLLVDGLHLTGAGYKIFLDMLLPLVGTEWATEDPDNPLWVFPHWSVAPKMG